MSQEKVICAKADCGMIFTERELVSLDNFFVIPEHHNPDTDGLCPGSFEAPHEISEIQLLRPIKSRRKMRKADF